MGEGGGGGEMCSISATSVPFLDSSHHIVQYNRTYLKRSELEAEYLTSICSFAVKVRPTKRGFSWVSFRPTFSWRPAYAERQL